MMVFLIALILGAAIVGLMFFLSRQGIKVSWYEWLIGIVGLFALLFTLQNYFAALNEFEPEAASTFLWVAGIPAIVLMGVAAILAWRRNRSIA